MKRILPVFATAVLVAVFAPACMQPPTELSVQTGSDGSPVGIAVTGHGEASGTPDLLVATVGVSVVDKTVDEAVAHASRAATAIKDALSHSGVADKDLQTSSYDIMPEYTTTAPDKRQVSGYRVTNSMQLKLRDLAHAGQVLDRVSTAAGNDVVISGLHFTIEKPDALLSMARDAAWNAAYAKASEIARLAGVRLGAPSSIREESPQRLPILGRALAMSEVAAAPVTPIEPGQLQVNVDLQVQFAMGGAAAAPAKAPPR